MTIGANVTEFSLLAEVLSERGALLRGTYSLGIQYITSTTYNPIDPRILKRIKNYLSNWVTWWVRTSEKWQYLELLKWYLAVCRDEMCSVVAHSLLYTYKLKDEARHYAAAAIIAE